MDRKYWQFQYLPSGPHKRHTGAAKSVLLAPFMQLQFVKERTVTGWFVLIFSTFLNILQHDVTGPLVVFDLNSLKVAGIHDVLLENNFPSKSRDYSQKQHMHKGKQTPSICRLKKAS